MKLQPVFSNTAPKPVGPYSQAIATEGFVFLSGQIALDPATGLLMGDTAAQQIRVAISNMQAVLRAAGVDVKSIVKTTIFLTSMDDFAAVNSVYEELMQGHLPARSVVAVAALPKNAKVEIEAIACR